MYNFANRNKEYNKIRELLDSNGQTIFIRSGKAIGVTSFLEDKLQPQLKQEGYLVLKINADRFSSISDAILDYIIKDEDLYNVMQKCFDRNYGSKGSSIAEKVSLGIPYIGNILSFALKEKTALPIYAGNFSSAIEEILTIFFSTITNDKIVILIDSAQSINEESYSTINDLIKYNNVKFVLVITEENDNYLKLNNYICVKGIKANEMIFPQPYAELVVEIGKLFNVAISEKNANQLIDASQKNIHKIISTFNKINYSQLLTSWDKAIVGILSIFKIGLSKDNLSEIIKDCELFSECHEQSLTTSLSILLSYDIIEGNESRYTLTYSSHPDIIKITESLPSQLIYKNAILKSFNRIKIISKSEAITLYQIADEIEDNSIKKYARLKIKFFLQDGSKIDKRVIANASFDDHNYNDCVVCSIIFARKRQYSLAIKWLEKINIDSNINIKTFYGILLSRVREHHQAEIVLTECMTENPNIENKVIIASYLISNYIHQEKLEEAQQLYLNALENYKSAKNIGYLIRNAISAYSGYQKDMYDLALTVFHNSNDMFGYYTTLCNQGYRLIETDKKEATKKLEESLSYIKLYGENISHIVSNDLGLAYLYSNKYDDAKECFLCVINSEEINMPYIFAKINLSFCNALMGNKEKAHNDITHLKNVVDNHPLDRVRQKYYINKLLIDFICGYNIDNITLKMARKYVDRYYPEKTEKTISYILSNNKVKNIKTNNIIKFYSPCGLAYWFVNPLKIFPEGFLDEIMTI